MLVYAADNTSTSIMRTSISCRQAGHQRHNWNVLGQHTRVCSRQHQHLRHARIHFLQAKETPEAPRISSMYLDMGHQRHHILAHVCSRQHQHLHHACIHLLQAIRAPETHCNSPCTQQTTPATPSCMHQSPAGMQTKLGDFQTIVCSACLGEDEQMRSRHASP
jgi:hypothetical protein